ncbi:NFAT activation molecule 1 [Talpa occidentalis]|uniref:NFAT activation molecule 1 n=1 Tax=Talpa occidentalis TaxID=50954 RepID=UPI00188EDB35|nr:NFAT activation molecule 1 [Talpa occidentalis]
MDGRPRRRWSPPGPSRPPSFRLAALAARLLALLLLAGPPQLAGGQSVTQNSPPIIVSLANTVVSFNCTITYLYTPQFKAFTVSYLHEGTHGRSSQQPIKCPPGLGIENQTHTVACGVTLKLANASATGTYYCFVHWQTVVVRGQGTFILVRDTGYQEPSQGSQRFLLFFFLGLLIVLSLLGTALLFWKKAQAPGKHLAQKCPVTSPAKGSQELPPDSDSVYTALQRRQTEVYSCIQSEASSPPTAQGLHSQEKLRRFEDDSEFNLVYENF